MAQRFGASSLHQRDSRSALFEGYTGDAASRRPVSASPRQGGYGYGGYGAPSTSNTGLGISGSGPQGGFRPATPNRRGQYSDAVLNELESQNDAHVEGILGKVKVLKDMTVAIGDRGTMNRMLLMAQRTGVGWKVWLAFFAAVFMLFVYVWLF
ncbi:hypothetical protein B0T10DRAFT_87937 [Thelonectria olida]|uniref:Uncharacterized protein n=1 Tax=Thelonectria olida TaxID=1576542 RepID=A0A9P9AJP5_9HYPO|nr:hypothetical protein B0T10DRAFT_87937 [Thelonectria olida]